jgi:hypothetical protein
MRFVDTVNIRTIVTRTLSSQTHPPSVISNYVLIMTVVLFAERIGSSGNGLTVSNLGRDAGYHDRFSCFYSVPPGKFRDSSSS